MLNYSLYLDRETKPELKKYWSQGKALLRVFEGLADYLGSLLGVGRLGLPTPMVVYWDENGNLQLAE